MGFKLLTPGNPKTEKGRGAGYWTFILHLAPARLSGWNVCPMATQGCIKACLNTAGRGGIMAGLGILTHEAIEQGHRNTIQNARIRRTRAYFENREQFMADLVSDIERACRLAEKASLVPVFRLNGTSDIRWEVVPVAGARNVMERFPHLQFYDYTKIPNRKDVPSNYHLTFSWSGENKLLAAGAAERGMNVAVVFRDKATVARYVAEGFQGGDVFVGDDTDLRFLDPQGVVVALYAKGNAKKDASGFVVD